MSGGGNQSGKAAGRILLWVQIGVTIALLAWLCTRVDARALAVIVGAQPWLLLGAVLVFASAQIFGGLKLQALVSGDRFSRSQAIRATFVGYFFSNFLPSTVGGDILRGARMKAAGIGVPETLGVLLLDRGGNSLLILGLAAITAPHLAMRLLAGASWTSVVALLSAAALIGIALAIAVLRIERVRRAMRGLLAPLKDLLRRPGLLLTVLLFTLASIGAGIVGQWLLGLAIGVPLSLLAFAGVACAITLVSLIPISVNGVGVQEAGYVLAFTGLGVSEPQAVAFAFAARLLILCASALGGGVFFVERLALAPRGSKG